MIENQKLTPRQLITTIVLFLIGSTVVVGVNINSDVAQDSWLSLIFSFAFSIPFALIYAKIINMFPGKNIYVILDEIFGKKIGKILSILFLIHVLYLGSIVLRNFSEFVEITTLTDTPQLVVTLCLMLIVIYLAKSDIKTLGRWGPICLTITTLVICFTVMLSIPVIEVDNILPILDHSLIKMTNSSFKVFMLPFSELVVFLGMADQLSIKNKEKKTFLTAIFITGILLLIVLLRNIMVLGLPLMKDAYFSSYEAARIIRLGEFLTRIEGVVTINFILGGITKITVFLIVLSKGIAHISNNVDYKKLIVPAGLLIFAICPFLFVNVLDMFDFAPIFGMYAIPVQVFFPIFILVFALLKQRKKAENKKVELKSKQLTFN